MNSRMESVTCLTKSINYEKEEDEELVERGVRDVQAEDLYA